jgi:hypothetical protein
MIAFGRADYKSSSMPVHRGHFHSLPESLYSMWAAPLGSRVYNPQLQSFPVATVKCFETIDLHAFSVNDDFLIVESMRDPGWQKVSHFMPDFTLKKLLKFRESKCQYICKGCIQLDIHHITKSHVCRTSMLCAPKHQCSRFCDDNSDRLRKTWLQVSAHLKHGRRSYLSQAPQFAQPPSTIAPAISYIIFHNSDPTLSIRSIDFQRS